MGTPNRLPDPPDEEPDERPQDRWETYEGRRIDPRFTTNADTHDDVRFNTHLNPVAVIPKETGATLKILLVVAGIVVLALISYFLFRGSNRQSPRSPESPSGQIQQQQAPVQALPAQAVLPLARLHNQEKRQLRNTANAR